MDSRESAQSLLGKKNVVAKPGIDATDILVLSSSFLLTTASIIFIALIFYFQGHSALSCLQEEALSHLQRVIATLSLTVTSAMIIFVGKYYVFSKFTRGGMRSRRVALYSRPSVGTLAYYLVRRGVELPSLLLLAMWGLALATGLTLNDAWAMVPITQLNFMGVPYGPLNAGWPRLGPASAQLSYVMSSVCANVAGIVGVVNITGDVQLTSGGPAGLLVYPPLPTYTFNSAFSMSTFLNGFNVSMESLPSLPSTAQNLTCVDNTGEAGGFASSQLWYGGGDNQTLSIITTFPNISLGFDASATFYRLNASAILLGGLLRSTGNATEFALNGTALPIMSEVQWAQDIASLVCNATFPNVGRCSGAGTSIFDFAVMLNEQHFALSIAGSDSETAMGIYWSTILGMAMGAYSYASWLGTGDYASTVLHDDLQFSPRYGVYVLIANVAVSILVLVFALEIRSESRLGSDFMDATRLLLNPLKNSALFNATLDTTVDALADPYMLVKDENEFLLADSERAHDT